MNTRHGFDRFQLKNDLARDYEIRTEAFVKRDALILNGNGYLAFYR